jgi:hypothetical protein
MNEITVKVIHSYFRVEPKSKKILTSQKNGLILIYVIAFEIH